jgi:hypothetical protein
VFAHTHLVFLARWGWCGSSKTNWNRQRLVVGT